VDSVTAQVAAESVGDGLEPMTDRQIPMSADYFDVE
jgi:hypothetical protein